MAILYCVTLDTRQSLKGRHQTAFSTFVLHPPTPAVRLCSETSSAAFTQTACTAGGPGSSPEIPVGASSNISSAAAGVLGKSTPNVALPDDVSEHLSCPSHVAVAAFFALVVAGTILS